MQTYHSDIFSVTSDKSITSASVYVYEAGTGPLATIYDTDEVTVLSNPFDINDPNYDDNGNIYFKAVNGEYDIKAVVGGENYWKRYIQLYDSDDSVTWEFTPVGGVIGLATHLTGVSAPPTDNSDFRYVLLTAGQDGVGQYNEGVVTTESITGTAPLVVATAVIDDTGSPFNGETINLWNTENRYPKPGETAGVVANDQIQNSEGSIDLQETTFLGTPSGVFTASSITGARPTGVDSGTRLNFSLSNVARTGTYTDVKHETLVYYMRIR